MKISHEGDDETRRARGYRVCLGKQFLMFLESASFIFDDHKTPRSKN